MKKLFAQRKGLSVFDTKETVIELNNVKIEAFPFERIEKEAKDTCLFMSLQKDIS
jgi:hypothetical protein